MSKRIKVGSTVSCRLFNSAKGKFFGDSWEGKVLDIQEPEKPWESDKRLFSVERFITVDGKKCPISPIMLARKEIKKIVS
jgi:hypothetical protein